MDGQAVIQQVRAGTVPASWQVYHARRSYFMQSAILSLAGAVVAVAAAIWLITSGTVIGIGVTDTTPPNIATFWLIVDMIVAGICFLGALGFAFARLRGLGSVDEQMLVLQPDGFVMVRGRRPRDTTVARFANVASLTPSVNNGTTSLVLVAGRSGKKLTIELDARFGPPKQIATDIQGMYAQYAHVRRQTSETED
jgi:hypothetical protein